MSHHEASNTSGKPKGGAVSKRGRKVTLTGLLINLLLGFLKISIGWVFGAKALVADGMHSFLDLFSDAAVLAAIHWSSRPEDETHHYGHHKFSSLAQFFIGWLILFLAVALVIAAFFHDSHLLPASNLSGVTVVVALISLVVKEGLFWWTRNVARQTHSDLLMANAWHHRTDSVSSFAVALTLCAVWIGGAEWRILDDIVSAVLGSYLAVEAGKIIWKSSADLLDAAPRKEIIDDLREHILTIPGAIAYHDFRVRKTGDYYEVNLHLQIKPELTVLQGHEIASEVKNSLQAAHPEVFSVLVHIEPATGRHLVERGISGGDDHTSSR
ncbi:cation transporter [Verrucomicrobiaceae bacterium N1E253]|uniref:Cation transporter n=1 Tax=Oceaniferula marina TaxID=2748318 RepID=A0A851GIW6_9BACT|nr:cation diffusion facilitator family transporter [Oceaniferula marina]NWK54590.1 cation transporter [Oceaniferula marina]